MRCDREDRNIKNALQKETEIPAKVLERVQETYRSLGKMRGEAGYAGAGSRERYGETEAGYAETRSRKMCGETEMGYAETRSRERYGETETEYAGTDRRAVRGETEAETAYRFGRSAADKKHSGKRQRKPRLTRYLLAAALAALAGGTVYAIQVSQLENRAESIEKVYETLRAEEPEAGMDKARRENREQTMERYKTEAERYQKMAERSDKEQKTFDLTELIGNAVVKEESYYDGMDFALVVSLKEAHEPVEYNFGPESDGFDALWTPEGLELELLEEQKKNGEISEEEYASRKEAAEKGMENSKVSIDENLGEYLERGEITEQEFDALKEIYEKDGTVGFISYSVGIGDHVLMADGSDLTYAPGPDGEGRYFIEPYGELPEQAKNLDALDVVLKIKKFKCCTYIDEDGVKSVYYPPVEPELVTVTLKNTSK